MTPLVDRMFDALDERVAHRRIGRTASRKIFPMHWSFLLGEVSLIAFVVLVATGLFLTMFYVPSTESTVYEGSSVVHQGREFPAAYESILRLSHDIGAGPLMRRVHRAASHLLIASTLLHFLRILLTGAFKRPREPNYHLGLLLLMLVIAAGWLGHSLPFDLASGTSLRIFYSVLLSVPLVGDPIAFWAFGGEFPTAQMVSRFFAFHALWLPIAITALIAVHLALVARLQHTQAPEDGVDGHRTVVGEPLWPWQAIKSAVLFLLIVGVLAASAVLVPWAVMGAPYRIGEVVNQTQPDWFLFWVEGLLRLVPDFEFAFLGMVWSQVFVVGAGVPLVVVGLLVSYPWIERAVTGPPAETHVLEHPLDVPFRAGMVTGVGAFLVIASTAAAQDVIARVLFAPVQSVTWTLRVLLLVVPPLLGLAVAAYARSQPSRWGHRS